MPSVTLNAKSMTIGLTPLELSLVQAAIAREGASRLEALISSYLQIQQGLQIEAERTKIKDFAETATDADRAVLVASIDSKRGGRP